MISRRRFVELGGVLAAASAVGCDDAPPQLSALLGQADASFAPPAHTEVDLVSHVAGRLSFGLRPGDHARVRALGTSAEEAVERYVGGQLSPAAIDDGAAERRLARYDELNAAPGELYEYKEEVLLANLTTAALRYAPDTANASCTKSWSISGPTTSTSTARRATAGGSRQRTTGTSSGGTR